MLAVVGDDLIEITERDDIIGTGFVDFQMRDDAIAGALALAQPSFFESFSMILTEAFAFGRPAIVRANVKCSAGTRNAATPPFPMTASPSSNVRWRCSRNDLALADAMGAAGKAYVEAEYSWDSVLERYEVLLERTVQTGRSVKGVL